jgi:hypothetical protein
MNPSVARKIALLKMCTIPLVIGCFLLAIAAFPIGYLPRWIFWPAVSAETFLGLYLLRKIRSLRGSA